MALRTSGRYDYSPNFRLCLYDVTGIRDPPAKSELALALRDTSVNDVFYHANPYNHDVKRVYSKLKTAKFEGAQMIRNATRAWRLEMQQFLPTVSHPKVPSHATESGGNGVKGQQNSDSAKANYSELSAKPSSNSEDITIGSAIQLPNCPPSENSTSEVGEDEAAELEAALTDSIFTRYQELVAQSSPNALPGTAASAKDSTAVEKVKVEGNTPFNRDPYSASPSPSHTPSHTPSISPPSAVDNTSSAPPTRSMTPSPSPVIGFKSAFGSPKRPLQPDDVGNVSQPGKKAKRSCIPAGKEVIVID